MDGNTTTSAPTPEPTKQENEKKLENLKANYEDKQNKYDTAKKTLNASDPKLNIAYKEREAAKNAYSAEAKKQGVTDTTKSAEEQQKDKTTKLTYNLNKIDVVPNPRMARLGDIKTQEIRTKEQFDSLFQVFCFDDAAYFDRLKNDSFSGKSGLGSLSHPLPIKYSFTILGCSGITRGDLFNVIGIPEKYSKHGVFQVSQVEHIVENMMWKTNIEGLYRQLN